MSEFIEDTDTLLDEQLVIQEDQIFNIFQYESGKRVIVVSSFDPDDEDDQNIVAFDNTPNFATE